MTAFEMAQRFVGEVAERAGRSKNNPLIVWWLDLCKLLEQPDETPWCSAFVNGICWLLRLPRTKSAAARSWLGVGHGVATHDARVGYDVVVLKRGRGEQPGAHVLNAPGHVGFFAGWSPDRSSVLVLGGNQGNEVSIRPFPVEDILGIRRLAA